MDRQRGHLTTKSHTSAITRLKILSMGDSNSGKSCLVKRYCEGRFILEYVATIGIDFGVKAIQCNDKEIKVNFWDVGGDPLYFDIRNEFYKDTHGAMLTIDVSSRIGFENIETWITELRDYANTNVVLYLVATKTDIQPRLVETSECESKAKEIGAKYFETSSLTGQGVSEMFDDLFKSSLLVHFPTENSPNPLNINAAHVVSSDPLTVAAVK
ncbi:hypothetical protein BDV3_001467 [Batrachochytrium dendrobatidis]|nr:hypothetical protein O5D80_004271 [Batrachochytrium dendrobatidis]KAK5668368.1 hypothetical protein QVD99_005394 [Batrachochytrium dendrobatidis]